MPAAGLRGRRGEADAVHAMILAAGRGERMRPLTDATPKPLLQAGGRPLLAWHLENLARAGITDIIINTGRLGERIEAALGTGAERGLRITYSHEGASPLDTGGGIRRALPLLGTGPFVVVNGDVWTDYDFRRLPAALGGDLAHLVMVDNPPHHPDGDFQLAGGRLRAAGAPRLTYAGLGVLAPALFTDCADEVFPLAPLLRRAMQEDRAGGEHYPGRWFDIGTPERLARLDAALQYQQ